MSKKSLFIISLAICAVSLNSYALVDPWSFPNYLQNFNTQLNTMMTAQRELTSLQNQSKNLGKVSDYQWQDATQLMNQMDSSMQEGQAISYRMADADTQFRQRYPDYTQLPVGQINYVPSYQMWNESTLDTLKNSLTATSIDANNIQSEEDVLNQLKQQGGSATGRMQALQVSTEIAGENVDQLLQLKRLMMAQMTTEDAYMAYKVSQDSYSEQQLDALVSNVDTQFPDYQNNPDFGKIGIGP